MPKIHSDQLLIAFSGTHGTGKSTTIKTLTSFRNDVYEDPLKVSRECQKVLGYKKLEDAYTTPKRMIEFQEMILETKISSDADIFYTTDKKIILTERSYLDIAAYTLQWVIRLIESKLSAEEIRALMQWYLRYEKRCMNMMYRYDGLIFVSPLTAVEFDVEPNRADLYSRDFIHETILDYLKNYDISMSILESDSVDSRVIQCNDFINRLIGK